MSEMKSIKDAFGTEVQVGDIVIFAEPVGYRNLTVGTVIKVCPKSVKVTYTGCPSGCNKVSAIKTTLPQTKFMKQPSEYAKPAYSIT